MFFKIKPVVKFDIDLANLKKVYVIGIKGSGVIAVVEILHSMGIEVTGSDTSEKFFTDAILQELQIKYVEHFAEKNVPKDADLIIYSTAYNEDNNVEFQRARELELPMVSYPEMLAYLFNKDYGVAVCGTHGKTTTSAWLANTLKEVGLNPKAIIGSKVKNWNGNSLNGGGKYFIAEADEYQDKLKLYEPKSAILTSCDWDHPDFFPDMKAYKNTFKNFVSRIPRGGFLVVWGDSTDTLEIADEASCDVLSYGFNEDCDYRINNLQKLPDGQKFEVFLDEQKIGDFEIKLFGRHNVLNATAVIAFCHKMDLEMAKVAEALRKFEGTARRFEIVGERKGAVLIDDYGHHPEEIKATLRAAREVYPEKNIWAIFCPHTFTRTKALLSEFAQSFGDADKVIVLDIYGSAREEQGGVHSEDLVKLVNKFDRGKAEYVPTNKEAVKFLKNKIGPDDVVISIGAGDCWEVVEKLKEK
jgi:UDP-N-acetylmuramate--alanine ligase